MCSRHRPISLLLGPFSVCEVSDKFRFVEFLCGFARSDEVGISESAFRAKFHASFVEYLFEVDAGEW